jgi:hypothetical protein
MRRDDYYKQQTIDALFSWIVIFAFSIVVGGAYGIYRITSWLYNLYLPQVMVDVLVPSTLLFLIISAIAVLIFIGLKLEKERFTD